MRTSTALLLSIAGIAMVMLPSSVTEAQRSRWRLDEGSVVRFTCEGPNIDEPSRGRFITATGGVQMDPDDLSSARGHVQVLLSSIATANTAWDSMFRAAHFLGISEHPRAMFELHEVSGQTSASSSWQPIELVGRLTIKGVHHDVRVPGRVRRVPADGETSERVELLATFSLLWSDHEIAVPEGWTREFAGDGARVRMSLVFTRRAS